MSVVEVKNKKSTLTIKFKKFFVDSKNAWQLYMFFLIPFIYLAIFSYYPMFGVQIAFKNYLPSKGIWGSPWAGFTHFITFFKSHQFIRTVSNTISLSLYSLCTGFPLAILFALMLNIIRNQKIKRTIQTITYIPHFISVIVIVGILFQVFNPVNGIYGVIYRIFGGDGYPKDLFTMANAFPHMYIWSGIWQNLGWSSIIYISALSSVDIELHEAAIIDGATRLQRIRYVDFPAILPTASIMFILNMGNIMSVGFEKVYLMQNTLNLARSEVISTYIYKVGLSSGANFSYGSAVGLFNSVINFAMLLIVNTLARKISSEGSSLW